MSGWTVLILILLILPLVLLSFPLAFSARGRLSDGEQRINLKLSWGWGLLAAALDIKERKTTFGLRLAGLKLPTDRGKRGAARAKKKDPKKARPGKKRSPGLPPITSVLNRQLLGAILGYLKRLYKSLCLRLSLRGVYGADDPAITGLLAGVLASLKTERHNLNLNADFSGAVIDLAGETSGRVIPIVILWLTLRLLLARPVRRIWWAQLKNKFNRKKQKEEALYV